MDKQRQELRIPAERDDSRAPARVFHGLAVRGDQPPIPQHGLVSTGALSPAYLHAHRLPDGYPLGGYDERHR